MAPFATRQISLNKTLSLGVGPENGPRSGMQAHFLMEPRTANSGFDRELSPTIDGGMFSPGPVKLGEKMRRYCSLVCGVPSIHNLDVSISQIQYTVVIAFFRCFFLFFSSRLIGPPLKLCLGGNNRPAVLGGYVEVRLILVLAIVLCQLLCSMQGFCGL